MFNRVKSWLAATVVACVWWTGVGGVAAAQPLGGEPQPAAPKDPMAFRAPIAVTRADLAVAYLDLERALRQRPPQGEEVAAVNRAFDALTGLFFQGQFGRAVARVHDLTRRVLGQPEPSYPDRLAQSVKVRVSPRVVQTGGGAGLKVEFGSMYLVARREETGRVRRAVLELTGPGGDALARGEVDVSSLSEAMLGEAVVIVPKAPAPGRYAVRIGFDDGAPAVVGWWGVTERRPGLEREAVEMMLDEAEGRIGPATGADVASSAMHAAVWVCRARAGLLVDAPSESNSAEFLANPGALAAEVRAEAEALRAGRNPYSGRAGDWWLRVPAGEVAARLYAPASVVADPARPAPLVIALHGAGGDENMFMEGYGVGEIRRLADKHGFIVLSPRSEQAMGAPDWVREAVAFVGRFYAVDPDRVYAIGHSMGAGGAASMALNAPGVIAGAACLAGGPFAVPSKAGAPILIYGAELDRLIPASRLESTAKGAQERGLSVEFQLVRGWGHTLVVGHVLPDAVERLLVLRRKALPEAAPAGGAPGGG